MPSRAFCMAGSPTLQPELVDTCLRTPQQHEIASEARFLNTCYRLVLVMPHVAHLSERSLHTATIAQACSANEATCVKEVTLA